MNHEQGLQKALIAHLRENAGVQAVLGGRIWDAAPVEPDYPHMTLGRCESRPIGADGGGIEQMLTLTVTSRFRGTEEAKAALAAVRVSLTDASLEADGIRVASLGVRFSDVWVSPGGHRTFAVLRVRAVTEEV